MASNAEIVFAKKWNDTEQLGKYFIVPEYKFHETRKWKFDFALPDYKIAIEIEGAIWVSGRHTRGVGYSKDIEKYNAATVDGWRVIRITPGMIKNEWENFVKMMEKLLG